jgi:arginase
LFILLPPQFYFHLVTHEGFAGTFWEAMRAYAGQLGRVDIEILGTPFNGLGTAPDIENPADGLRQARLVPLLQSEGHSVTDLGDLSGFHFQGVRDPESGIQDLDQWIGLSNALSTRLGAILERGSFPLLLGGDCAMLVGVFSAFAQRDTEVGIVFLDGHADFHTPGTSPGGDPADMELAVLTGRGGEAIVRAAGKDPLLRDDEVVVYGIRAWNHISESDIPVYDSRRMAEMGMKAAVGKGLAGLAPLPLWLHLDVDVLDPKVMPVMYPEPGGLTYDQVREFCRLVWASGRTIGLSVACYHPSLDRDGSAGARLVALLADVLSGRRES